MIILRKSLFERILAYLACLLAFSPLIKASDYSSYTTTQLNDEIGSLIEQSSFIEARPYLEELIKRYSDPSSNGEAFLPDLSFFMAFSYLQSYQSSSVVEELNKSLQWFDKCIKQAPSGSRVGDALEKKAQIYYMQKKYDKAFETWTNLYNNYKKYSKTKKDQLATLDNIIKTYYMIGCNEKNEAAKLKILANSEKWFNAMIENSIADDNQKSIAVSGLMQAYVIRKEFEKAKGLMKYLMNSSPARYDINLNQMLLIAGDAIVQEAFMLGTDASYAQNLNERLSSIYVTQEKLDELISSREKASLDIENANNKLENIKAEINSKEKSVSSLPYDEKRQVISELRDLVFDLENAKESLVVAKDSQNNLFEEISFVANRVDMSINSFIKSLVLANKERQKLKPALSAYKIPVINLQEYAGITAENAASVNEDFKNALAKIKEVIPSNEKIADMKSKEGQFYTEATLFYSMVLNVDQIIAYNKKAIEVLNKGLTKLKSFSTGSKKIDDVQKKVDAFQRTVDALKKIKSYSSELALRKARNYLLTDRPWESFWAYDILIKKYPTHNLIKDFYYSAFSAAKEIHKVDKMVEIANEYLSKYSDEDSSDDKNKYAMHMAFALVRYYHDSNNMQKFEDKAKLFIYKYPNSDSSKELIFLLSSYLLKNNRSLELVDFLEPLMSENPDTVIFDGALYWCGLAYLQEGKIAKSNEFFNRHLELYSSAFDSVYTEDAAFRKSVNSMSLGNSEETIKYFNEFCKIFDENHAGEKDEDKMKLSIRGEAEFFLGDIYSLNGRYAEAERHFKNVERYTDNQSYIDQSYFTLLNLYIDNLKYNEAENLMNRYVSKYPDSDCVAKAYFELGKCYDANGKSSALLNNFENIINNQKNLSNKLDEGVDEIILEYPVQYYKAIIRGKENIDFLEMAIKDESFIDKLLNEPKFFNDYFAKNRMIDDDSMKIVLKSKRQRDADVNFLKNLKIALDEKKNNFKVSQKTPIALFQELSVKNANNPDTVSAYFRLQMGLENMINAQFVSDDVKKSIMKRNISDVDLNKLSARTLIWAGEKFQEQKELDLAIEAYEKVSDVNGEFASSDYGFEALMALGNLYARQFKFGEALTQFSNALDYYPGRPDVWKAALRKADMFLEQSQIAQAQTAYKDIFENPSWADAAKAEAMNKYAQSFSSQGNIKEAIHWFERALLLYSSEQQWKEDSLSKVLDILNKKGDAAKAEKIKSAFAN